MKHSPPPRISGPAWLYRHIDDEKQIADDIISLVYWNIIDERARANVIKNGTKFQEEYDKLCNEIQNDAYVAARNMAEAMDFAWDQTSNLGETLERARVRITLDMEKMNLLPLLEARNVAEYLYSKKLKWDGEGKMPSDHYDIDFLITTLFPILTANGFNVDIFIGIAENMSKARIAVPVLKNLLVDVTERVDSAMKAIEETKDPEEIKQLETVIEESLVLDPRLKNALEILMEDVSTSTKKGGPSVKQFREKIKGVVPFSKPDKVLGYTYHLNNGVHISISADPKVARLIQARIEDLVDFHNGDPVDIARQVSSILIKERANENTHIDIT